MTDRTVSEHRLSTRQMADFVAHGYLRFDALVPDDINVRAIDELAQLNAERLLPNGMKPPHSTTALDECYPLPSAIGEYLRLPAVRWHAGQPNPGANDRWLYKIRLDPTEPQVRLGDTSDFDDVQSEPTDHVFARMAPGTVAEVLRTWHPWMGITDYRSDQIQRARHWRYLTGDETFDVGYYLTRLEGRAALVEGSS